MLGQRGMTGDGRRASGDVRAAFRIHEGQQFGSNLPATGCTGLPPMMRRLRGRPFGHRIQCADIDLPGRARQLYFCVRCGAWAMRRCVNLASVCRGAALPGSAGHTALQRIRAGRHPATAAPKVSSAHRFLELDVISHAVDGEATGTQHQLVMPSAGSRLESVIARIRARL